MAAVPEAPAVRLLIFASSTARESTALPARGGAGVGAPVSCYLPTPTVGEILNQDNRGRLRVCRGERRPG
jgi:hypothetical protein